MSELRLAMAQWRPDPDQPPPSSRCPATPYAFWTGRSLHRSLLGKACKQIAPTNSIFLNQSMLSQHQSQQKNHNYEWSDSDAPHRRADARRAWARRRTKRARRRAEGLKQPRPDNEAEDTVQVRVNLHESLDQQGSQANERARRFRIFVRLPCHSRQFSRNSTVVRHSSGFCSAFAAGATSMRLEPPAPSTDERCDTFARYDLRPESHAVGTHPLCFDFPAVRAAYM